MKSKILHKLKEYAYFIWLLALVFAAVFVTYYYDINKKNQIFLLQKTFKNVYFNKTIESITSKLKPRYITINYKIKDGDTYDSIIGNLEVSALEKKKILEAVKKEKEIKYLKQNQQVYFKLDRKGNTKILEFKIEINKKKELVFLGKKTL